MSETEIRFSPSLWPSSAGHIERGGSCTAAARCAVAHGARPCPRAGASRSRRSWGEARGPPAAEPTAATHDRSRAVHLNNEWSESSDGLKNRKHLWEWKHTAAWASTARRSTRAHTLEGGSGAPRILWLLILRAQRWAVRLSERASGRAPRDSASSRRRVLRSPQTLLGAEYPLSHAANRA